MHTEELQKQYNVLWRECNALYEAWAKKHGCSYSELLVILSIYSYDGHCTQKEICQHWQFPKQTVNSILKGFLKKKYIQFTPLANDRRNKEIQLTFEGRTTFGKIVDAMQHFENIVWNRMGQEKCDALVALTQDYNTIFKEVINDETT